MSGLQQRKVSWLCDEEWYQTYEQLFYGSVEEQWQALDTVNVWRLRFAGGSIPVAIEATSRLLEALLVAGDLKDGACRQILSAGITQFIGLMTERGLKGNTRKPIHEIGEDLGIPEWITNLRHEMAHGPLPPLVLLEKAVVFALDWLKHNHWDVQVDLLLASRNKHDDDVIRDDNDADVEMAVLKLVKRYRGLIDKSHDDCDDDLKPLMNEVIERLTKALADHPSHVPYLCNLLTQHHFLQCRYDPQLKADQLETKVVHQEPFAHWKLVIKIVKAQLQIPCLLLGLIERLGDSGLISDDDDFSFTLAVYIYYCVDALINNPKGFAKLQQQESQKAVLIKCVKLLTLMENKYSKPVYEKLSTLLVKLLPKENLKQLNQLQNCGLQNSNNAAKTKRRESQKPMDVDYKTPVKTAKLGNDKAPQITDSVNGWSMYNGPVLDKCPLGLMPGQTPLSLASSFYDEDLAEIPSSSENQIIMNTSYSNDKFDDNDNNISSNLISNNVSKDCHRFLDSFTNSDLANLKANFTIL